MNTASDLLSALKGTASSLSPAEERLAAHLVEHPDIWGFRPTTEVAAMLGMHRSTIVRFAQRLGFTGFPHLQDAVRTLYMDSVSAPLDLGDHALAGVHEATIRAIVERELTNLRNTYAKLDMGVLEDTARRVAEARNVLVFGRRFSHAIALGVSLTLRTLRGGVRIAPEHGGSSLDSVFDLSAQDAAVVISLRRHSPPVQRMLEHLDERHVPTTLMTDASPIARIPSSVQVLHAHIGSTSTLDSFTSLVSVGHTLCTLVGRLMPDANARWRAVESARSKLQVD